MTKKTNEITIQYSQKPSFFIIYSHCFFYSYKTFSNREIITGIENDEEIYFITSV